MTTIKLRRGNAASWSSANPLLADGEMGVELDTARLKFGDGVKTWNLLEYHFPTSDVQDLIDAAILALPPGVQGAPGTAYLSAQWNFNQNTAVSPASGTMRMNATTYAAVTTLWIHEIDRDGLDRSVGLSLIVPGNQIIMQSAQGRVVWEITEQADSGAYRTFTVTMVESSGNRPSASSPTTLYFATVGESQGGGGYVGAWNSLTAYPAGSIVTYNGSSWGCLADIAAGQTPPSSTVTPTTNVPIGTNMGADAPSVQISSDGESASSISYSNSGFTTESGETGSRYLTSWHKYRPASTGSTTFTTIGSSGVDTILTLYSSPELPFAFSNLSQVGEDDDAGGGGTSSLTSTVTANQLYYIRIAGYNQSVGTYKLNLVGARKTSIPGNWTQLGVITAPVLVLGPATPVPGGTAAGTVIVRTVT